MNSKRLTQKQILSGSAVLGAMIAACAAPAIAQSQGPFTAAQATAGAGLYQSSCAACHGTGVNNAPVFGNAEAWAPRIAKGTEELMNSLVNGYNNGAMPAKGLCMDCSNDDLQATLDYMLQAVQ